MVRLLALVACIWMAVITSAVAQTDTIRLGFVFSDTNVPATLAAYRQVMAERPELQGRVALTLLSESTVDQLTAETLAASDVLVFDMMNEQLLAAFDARHQSDILGTVSKEGVVLGVGEGLSPAETFAAKGVTLDARASAYWAHGGAANHVGLMKQALAAAGVAGFTLPDPERSLDFGYYYPTVDGGRVFASWDVFHAFTDGKAAPDAPSIAVGFFKASFYAGDMAVVDAVIAEIERRGARAIPVFGYPGPVAFQRLLLDEDGRPRADAAVALNFQFADSNSSPVMQSVGITAINAISLYGRSEAEWRASPNGLSSFEGTFNVAVPELAGAIAPTVVASSEKVVDATTGLTVAANRPITERVETAVGRALGHANLRRKPNAEKRIALVYYNYPSGRANIGASYLNVAETLHNVLSQLEREGYDLGVSIPSATDLLDAITNRARNVMGAAPGELEALIAQGDVVRVSRAQYAEWLNQLPHPLREKIVEDWGTAGQSGPMVARDGSMVVPVLRFGNVVLTPQPARGWGENLQALYHAKDLAPHHQYVAAYGWLRHAYQADAIVHIGTHGTLEWLDGKDVGLSEEDASDALIGTTPHGYIYNVDVVGEGLVARRRSAAVLVDHMVPPFVEGGLTNDLAKLSELLNDHSVNEGKNPEMAVLYARQARDQAIAMGLTKDLGLDASADWSDEDIHQLEAYLLGLKSQTIPFGMHAFGRTPDDEAIASTVRAIASVDRENSLGQPGISADEIERRIRASGPRELESLMRMLGGQFVGGGTGGEPIRNPDAYATGKNFYGLDPEKLPKPVAWDMGVRLANEFLKNHLGKHGSYPQKVSFVIWGDETMRHEGVLESQIFHLLGTRPVWDARGKVVDVELVSRGELGRPRVDIVIASAAEGMFANLTRLLDKAVQLAKDADEADNAVRNNYLAIRQALIDAGTAEADADRMASVRIFDEPPGQFNLNTSAIAANSGSWDSDAGMANDYISKMGHAYGAGYWGDAMPDVFKLVLADTDTVIHSSSTTLYGALDNDDMYMYMGGLSAAIRSVSRDGQAPELMITNTRDPDRVAMTDIHAFIGSEFRSRYVNPNWIRGMQGEGYAGAGAIREFVEYLWGWEATVADTVDDAMWSETFETYVQDKHDLGMKAFFESQSPYAYQDITARMIETIRKGGWNADVKIRRKLLQEYLASVNQHGVNCTEASCGNARLLEYVLDEAQAAGLDAEAITHAKDAFESAMGRSIKQAADELRSFAAELDGIRSVQSSKRGELDLSSQAPAGPPPVAAPAMSQPSKGRTGFVMERDVLQTAARQSMQAARIIRLRLVDLIWPLFALVGILAFTTCPNHHNSARGRSTKASG